jgi:two-component system, chemotaxis family, CheB/CheR fusion protein
VGSGTRASRQDLGADSEVARVRRVLIVDDNVDAGDSMVALVGAWGHTAKVARDASEALALAVDFKPDTALVDIGLPGMNGYEIARRWRATPEGQNLTLVAMTGKAAFRVLIPDFKNAVLSCFSRANRAAS